MKASELRIGNWYEYLIRDEVDQPKEYWDQCTIDAGDIVWLHNDPDNRFYRPIPLTDEWLRKFGFVNGGYDFLFWNLDWFELAGTDELNEGEEIPEYAFNIYVDYEKQKHQQFILNYVHQLQNLYFALTGEELEIKE